MDTGATPGWYNAQGDPPGTQRYWDGSIWTTEAVPSPGAAVQDAHATADGPKFPSPPGELSPHDWERVEVVERSPWEWFMFVVRDNYANFDGRARRAEYWWFTAVYTGLTLMTLTFVIPGAATESDLLLGLGIAAMGIVLVILFIPGLAVLVRRLHDTNRSGAWYFITFLPFGTLIMLIFMVMDGTHGPNDYGPDPKGRAPQYQAPPQQPIV